MEHQILLIGCQKLEKLERMTNTENIFFDFGFVVYFVNGFLSGNHFDNEREREREREKERERERERERET